MALATVFLEGEPRKKELYGWIETNEELERVANALGRKVHKNTEPWNRGGVDHVYVSLGPPHDAFTTIVVGAYVSIITTVSNGAARGARRSTTAKGRAQA